MTSKDINDYIKTETYYNNSNNNIRVFIGDISFFFSYGKIIALKRYSEFIVIDKKYSQTTTKHQNFLVSKGANRVLPAIFEKRLTELIQTLMY